MVVPVAELGEELDLALAPAAVRVMAQPKRFVLLPENKPKELRGKAIRVTFWVDPAGKVEKVAFDPEIRDRGYAKKFLEAMLNYEFRPARGPDGAPVPGVTVITVTV